MAKTDVAEIPVNDSIDAWFFDSKESASLMTGLDPQEIARANRYTAPEARERYVRNRTRLRLLLSRYLRIPPDAVALEAGAHGKPALAGAAAGEGLCFNLSHSGPYALFGFGRDCLLGVDVEVIRERDNVAGLAKSCLGPEELAAWLALPPEQRMPAFFRYWVCKEAFLKATGRGLALGLKKVHVRPDFSGYIDLPPDFGPPDHWSLVEWGNSEFRAAVAYSGTPRVLKHCDDADLLLEKKTVPYDDCNSPLL